MASGQKIFNNEYGLAETHAKMYTTLEAFDRVCREHGIRYSLHGGTLLGAVRNHHFIPWDDDLDISMLRSEYDKLEKVMDSAGPDSDCYLDKDTFWVPHFVMKGGADDAMYIDLFLWDYISEKKAEQRLKLNLLHAVQGMMKEKELLRAERFGTGTRILIFLTYYAGKLFSKRTKQRIYTAIGTRMLLGRRQYIHRYNDSFRGLTYILDADYMNHYSDIELEGGQFMVNDRCREFLISEYGPDYMTPPPEKDRKTTHEAMRQWMRDAQGERKA